MKKANTTAAKPLYLYIDQYGTHVWAHTLKELRAQVRGSCSKMYVGKKDGRTVSCGYVIGWRWLTKYLPVEVPA